MTVLFYLNDVEEGGETAFVLANNATYDVEVSDSTLVLHVISIITFSQWCKVRCIPDHCSSNSEWVYGGSQIC